MSNNINIQGIDKKALREAEMILKKLLKDDLIKIILYGSYARGDYSELSDIDLFILVKNDKEELSNILNTIIDKLFELDLKYNITINPLIENSKTFNKYKDYSLLFENIEKEGVVLYG